MTTRTAARAARLDQVCADAVGIARGAITEVEPADIGEHLEAVAEGDRVVTHFFESHLAGYKGWRWAVTVTRVPRSRHVTICETVLLPGPDALLAPGWLPWNERVQPGDLGVGDLMATAPDDERLAPGYVLSDDSAVEDVSWELGLGRPGCCPARAGPRPHSAGTTAMRAPRRRSRRPRRATPAAAPAASTCRWSARCAPCSASAATSTPPDDAKAVSADHGCGAHSEALVGATEQPVEELPTIYDDSEVEAVAVSRAHGSVEAGEPAEPYGHS
nr:DUF3027 domain-containing protein [Actinoplanes digitatis]